MSALRRVPFLPHDAEAWAAFCVAHGGPHDAALVRRLLVHLTSHPTGVFAFADGEERAAVCTVVDLAPNHAGEASLEILGARSPLTGPLFADLVVAPAVTFTRGGVRSGLQVVLYPSLVDAQGAEIALTERGFQPIDALFVMRRPADTKAPPALPLDDGWHWEPLGARHVTAVHSALAEIFRDAPSFSLAPLHDFQRSVDSGSSVWRVLFDDGHELAGVVQVSARGERGTLRTVGLRPGFRARGLGRHLVAEGLRVLLAHGTREIDLEVAAENVAALALYHRFGFEVATRAPALALRF